MPNHRASSGAPETVLVRGGTTARFDGSRLLIVRGRTTWTVPVEALAFAELAADNVVRIEIGGVAGDTPPPVQELGQSVELGATNARAAQAFHEQVSAAMARVRRAEDGRALVRMERESPGSFTLSPVGRRVAMVSCGIAVYALLLAALGAVGPLERGDAVASLILGGVAGLVGAGVLWRVGRRVRSLWLLRRRGIGVVGQVTGFVKIWAKGGHLWEFSRMRFRTVDKQYMQDVPSVVTIWAFKQGASSGRAVDLIYDPKKPSRASRPLTVGFAFRTLVFAVPGVLLVAYFSVSVWLNLPT
ncbi:DUF3592 domain-containing protein [Streptomyces sp. NPDC058067]|uniref:DUF3592 domain-containing protein n=1 Tax=Streptomyces sp. NPDC058067 TaxID=3346324 RepID=UPI0036E01AE2